MQWQGLLGAIALASLLSAMAPIVIFSLLVEWTTQWDIPLRMFAFAFGGVALVGVPTLLLGRLWLKQEKLYSLKSLAILANIAAVTLCFSAFIFLGSIIVLFIPPVFIAANALTYGLANWSFNDLGNHA